jgi:hypothetical protein
MRGHKNYNFEAFFLAEALLEMKGHDVVNPARLDIDEGQAWWSPTDDRIVMAQEWKLEDAMRRDIIAMARDREAIVLLPGWEGSQGANHELTFARTIGLREFAYCENGDIGTLITTEVTNTT